MINNRTLLESVTDLLSEKEVPEPELNAKYMLEYAYSLAEIEIDGISWFLLHGDDEVSEEVLDLYKQMVPLRMMGIPLEYVIGYTEFMGLRIETDARALIPRQDTEVLVEEVLKYCGDADVIDLCTGSGCIAVSLAKLGNCRSVTATDIEQDALELAVHNSIVHDVYIEFIWSDIWNSVTGIYDIVVANPPYIRSDVIPTLMREVKDHEPGIALDGGEDGLYFYRKIINGLDDHLRGEGRVFFEIGYDQADDVSGLLKRAGFDEIKVVKDLAGLDRVVMGKNSGGKD